MKIIGVDPGLTGAYAILEADGSLLTVDDLPVITHGKAKWIDAGRLRDRIIEVLHGDTGVAVVEHTHAMPKTASATVSSMGMTLGSTLAAVQMSYLGIELVTPAQWKGALGLTNPKATDTQRKKASLDRARLLFPTADLPLEKSHNRAESLLIAYWRIHRAAGKMA